jgi:hypothetical protein
MSLARRGMQALLGAGLMLMAAGCDEPASPAAARAAEAAPGIFGSFVLDPAQSEDYDPSDPCGVPLSSTMHLEGGTWRSEWTWAPGCREGGKPGEPASFVRGGPLEVHGDSFTLRNSAPVDEFDVETGRLEAGKLTIYGHCGGMDVYVPRPSESASPAPRRT